jgi:hypothetical protein
MAEALGAFRHDVTLAIHEIWTSAKTVCETLFKSITVVKIIELTLIGLFLAFLPDAFNVLLKTLAKLGKL